MPPIFHCIIINICINTVSEKDPNISWWRMPNTLEPHKHCLKRGFMHLQKVLTKVSLRSPRRLTLVKTFCKSKDLFIPQFHQFLYKMDFYGSIILWYLAWSHELQRCMKSPFVRAELIYKITVCELICKGYTIIEKSNIHWVLTLWGDCYALYFLLLFSNKIISNGNILLWHNYVVGWLYWGLMPLQQLGSYHGGWWRICVSWLSHTSTNTTFLSKATDYFSHMLLQRWGAKKRRKEKLPQLGIKLPTTRSWVRHAHHWANRAGLWHM